MDWWNVPARRGSEPTVPDDDLPKLSAQYRQMLSLLCEGLSYTEIAEKLEVTHACVTSAFNKTILPRLGVRLRHQAVAQVWKRRLAEAQTQIRQEILLSLERDRLHAERISAHVEEALWRNSQLLVD